ncbi:ABC-type branched-chain amino acid transport system, permease component [Enhydrobacter aerosaccus]|uniref:ABC-type branched-chain amino acid transport system, permease component n=1 Tax=Enhydrobacter aerosaccus TaxID=225324 RepID=A0A1T4JVK0_9HYPH|nr:alpha/beta fold hydrolase [Enhydrobacter aerosaccus]SJZ34188.1 ABC-type branched-chain amino acid transport system, permease component [Enhydrobacter aerosaccus]
MRYDPPFHRTNGLWPALSILAVLIGLPLFVVDPYTRHLLVLSFIFAAVAASWDLSLGFGGLFNFAHGALFAVGLYSFALAVKFLGLSPWLAIPLGGLVAMIVAALIALPVLRLDGIYVILVTIAVSQLLYQVTVSQSKWTGGTSGIVSLPALRVGDYSFIRDGKIGYYYAALLLLVLATTFLYGVIRSPLGRAIVGLRDHKYFAIARGVSEARTRLLTLVASALFTGIAGAFYGSYVRVASPDVFGLSFLTLILSILLVGGVATLWGPIVSAFVMTFLSEAIVGLGPWREIIMGIVIVLVVSFYPGGLWAAVQELRERIDTGRTAMLVSWRRRMQRRTRVDRMAGAEEFLLATRHGCIAVSDTGGDKPAILLLHGNSACKEAFAKQFAALKAEFRLVAFDLPGHGVSDNGDPETSYNVIAYAEIAEAVIEARGLHRPVVFGWSLGGYVGLELAARAKVPVAGLAICGTSPLTVVPDDFAAGYDASSHLILASKQYFTRAEAAAYAGSATAPKSAESAYLHRNLPRTDGRARVYMMTKLPVVNWPRQMRMLRDGKLPFAIINGADDPFLNRGYLLALCRSEGWSHPLVNIPNGKHAPFFNTPQTFNEIFLSFCRQAFAAAEGQDARATRP